MYGTREAASAWAEKVNEVMTNHGFMRSMFSPCIYVHTIRGVEVMVHGDDFISVGEEEDLVWMKGSLEEEFELTFRSPNFRPGHHAGRLRFIAGV